MVYLKTHAFRVNYLQGRLPRLAGQARGDTAREFIHKLHQWQPHPE